MPKKLVVIGGGYIGLEFASMFNNLGTEVDIFIRGAGLLRGFDKEVQTCQKHIVMPSQNAADMDTLICGAGLSRGCNTDEERLPAIPLVVSFHSGSDRVSPTAGGCCHGAAAQSEAKRQQPHEYAPPQQHCQFWGNSVHAAARGSVALEHTRRPSSLCNNDHSNSLSLVNAPCAPQVVEFVTEQYEKKGLRIHKYTNPSSIVKHDDGSVTVHADKQREGGDEKDAIQRSADCCLMATGRKANTKNLGLENVSPFCKMPYKIMTHRAVTTYGSHF